MGVSIVMGVPPARWMVQKVENPEMDDFIGGSPWIGNPHIGSYPMHIGSKIPGCTQVNIDYFTQAATVAGSSNGGVRKWRYP